MALIAMPHKEMAGGPKHIKAGGGGAAAKSMQNHKPKRKSKKKTREEERGGEEDHGSWRHLPPDVAAKILGLLPLHHAINAMAVCKQWRASLLQHSMSQDAEGDMLSPLFFSTSWWGYHGDSRRWVRYPNLAFLPFSITRVHSSHRGILLVEADIQSPVEADSQSPPTLYLCNFATQRHWPLPPLFNSDEGDVMGDFSMYWCHCYLRVDDDRLTFTITALTRANFSSGGWPQLVRFDSCTGSWTSPLRVAGDDSCGSLIPKVFFEGVDRIVVLPNGAIYIMVPGREGRCYLVKYDPEGCVWAMVSKALQVTSAQIVASGDTLMVVAMDRSSRQMHLYRLMINKDKEEELVLEESSGPELAGFVEDCGVHFWYTTSLCSSSRSRSRSSGSLYVGVHLNNYNAEEQQQQQALVEYEGLSRTWRHVPLPDFIAGHGFKTCNSIISADAYHELGLATQCIINSVTL